MTDSATSAKKDWKGYTIDELAYHRAVALIRIDVEKERISREYSRVSQGNILLSKSLFTRVVSVMSYADFIVLGVKMWRRVAPLFKKKK